MKITVSELAARYSFQLIANCYLREGSEGTWHDPQVWKYVAEHPCSSRCQAIVALKLNWLNAVLWIGINERSRVGCHKIGAVFLEKNEILPLDFTMASVLLLREIGGNEGLLKQRTEMMTNVFQSHLALESSIHLQSEQPSQKNTFIFSEQSAVLGHWFHPAPMNRIGMASWQNAIYSPEYRTSFQLHYFGIKRASLELHGISEEDYMMEISQYVALRADEDFYPIPVHPLQAQYLLSQSRVKKWLADGILRNYGILGKNVSATSSVRSVYQTEASAMLKLSIPVKITNSFRTNKRRDLLFCSSVSSVLKSMEWGELSDRFELLLDHAGATLKDAEIAEIGFEVLFRSNPFIGENANHVFSPVTLFQEPMPGGSMRLNEMVIDLAYAENCSVSRAAQRWFEAYVECTLLTLIQVFDRFGIAFESHVQNCLIRIENMLPVKLYHRDTEGSYFSENLQASITEKHPGIRNVDAVFFPEEKMTRVIGYYLVINHLFAAIHRFSSDGLMDDQTCIATICKMLAQVHPACGERGKNLIDYLLHRPTLECKSNLKTQLQGIDELANPENCAVYVEIPNPFYFPPKLTEDPVYHGVLDQLS